MIFEQWWVANTQGKGDLGKRPKMWARYIWDSATNVDTAQSQKQFQ